MTALLEACPRCGRVRHVNSVRAGKVCNDCRTTEVPGVSEHATAWKGDGNCSQTDPESFLSDLIDERRYAARVCIECPVRAQCLDYALRFKEEHGVWGGLTAIQRRRLAKSMGLAA